jgi:hypothetical protein
MKRRRKPVKRGALLLECVVALGLAAAGLGLVATMVVRERALLADERAYRVAVEELTNHLERMTGLPPAKVADELEKLASAELPDSLKGCSLRGETRATADSLRVTLTLEWDPRHLTLPAIRLVGWSFAPEDGGAP